MTERGVRRPGSRGRGLPVGALALLVGGGAAIVVGSAVDTAQGRFSASTSNDGSFLRATEIELSLGPGPDGGPAIDAQNMRSSLAIDADNLVPRQTVERCIPVSYVGGIEADIRLIAAEDDDSTGLASYLDTRVLRGTGSATDCSDFQSMAEEPLWSGTLAALGDTHSRFADGLSLLENAGTGDSITTRVSLTLADDDRAQGLTTSFWVVFEVRP